MSSQKPFLKVCQTEEGEYGDTTKRQADSAEKCFKAGILCIQNIQQEMKALIHPLWQKNVHEAIPLHEIKSTYAHLQELFKRYFPQSLSQLFPLVVRELKLNIPKKGEINHPSFLTAALKFSSTDKLLIYICLDLPSFSEPLIDRSKLLEKYQPLSIEIHIVTNNIPQLLIKRYRPISNRPSVPIF